MSTPTRRTLLASLGAAGLAAAVPTLAQAEDWPSKPIRVIVPFAPGGGVDVLARAVMAELSTKWKQPIIVDNRAGAGSLIGAEAVAKSAPDGYTLMATVNQTLVGNRFLYKNLSYDPDKSFEPITLMVQSDQMLLATPSFPANNMKELLEQARKNPGKIAYGSFGAGSQPHLLYSTIAKRENVQLLHVPYKGITPVLQALVSGEVQLGTGSLAVAGPLIDGGKIKAISVAGKQRIPRYPQVPTTVEQGYPYAQTSIWYGLFAPAGTPAPIVEKIRKDVSALLNDPGFAERNATSKGLTVIASTGEELRKIIAEETQTTSEQIKAAGVTPE